MPPAVAAVAGAAFAGGLAYASGTVIFGLTVAQSALLIGIASMAVSFVPNALPPKPQEEA